MSCLPQLFASSKSQPLAPQKIGGHFSIHLRSSHFNIKENNQSSTRRLFQSGDNKRYRSWMDTDRSFRTSKRSSKSFFHKQRQNHDYSLVESNPQYQNINGKDHLQSQLEAASSFKSMKKQALEQTHLATKTIQYLSTQQAQLKEGLSNLKTKIQTQLDDITEQIRTSLANIHFSYKEERRQTMADGKAISKQLKYLISQVGTARSVAREAQLKFNAIAQQFF